MLTRYTWMVLGALGLGLGLFLLSSVAESVDIPQKADERALDGVLAPGSGSLVRTSEQEEGVRESVVEGAPLVAAKSFPKHPAIADIKARAQSIISRKMKGVTAKNRVIGSRDSVESVCANPRYNPDRKELVSAQVAELTSIIEEYRLQSEAMGDICRQTHCEASLAALEGGQMVTQELRGSSGGNQEAIGQAKQGLSDRLGAEGVDWRCEQVWWSSSSGDSRFVLVWYMKVQNAAAFEAADAFNKLSEERSGAYKKFFESVR